MNEALDTILDQGVAAGAAAGVSAVVVDRQGVRYQNAFGMREAGGDVAMTTDTVGAIFSMTKAVTGAAAMQLVERGRLDLDGPASQWCPVLGELQVLDGFDTDGQPMLRPPREVITLRHLLTHTSGLAYDIWNADIGRWAEVTGAPDLSTGRKAALATPLAFDPGQRWEYGIGIDWVGQLIEAVTGQTLGEYFAESLTGPLGMVDTGFTHHAGMATRAASMHARLPDGSLVPMELPSSDEPAEFEMGGGGLHSTMPDYARFLAMVLNDGQLDGRRLLEAETVHQMSSNHMGDLRVQPLASANPALSHDAEFFPGEPKSWGLTFQINETPCHTGRPAGTLMWAGLSNSYFWIDRTTGVAGAFMTQTLPFADPAALGLFLDFETAVYEAIA